jgi:hypothetical protein
MFFSRRIGLDGGQPVPIRGGARLTGRMGRTSVGVLAIQTGESVRTLTPATDFVVARIRRDVLRRSNIGVIATRRAPRGGTSGPGDLLGLDTSWNLFENIQAGTYYARSAGRSRSGDQSSYRGYFRYVPDRYGFEIDRMKIGDGFDPQVGYIQRPDITRTNMVARFSPRVRRVPSLRKLEWNVEVDRFVDGRGQLETRVATGTFRIDFNSSNVFQVKVDNDYEFLEAPFKFAGGPVLPVGSYSFTETIVQYTVGPQRPVSGRFILTAGEFYSGHRQQFEYSGRANVSARLGFEPRLLISRITLPQGNFTTTLAGSRTTFGINPHMFVSALVQYNSSLSTLESNVRWRWEYQPGSDLFVVYTDARDTFGPRAAALMNRGLAIKATRLLRF